MSKNFKTYISGWESDNTAPELMGIDSSGNPVKLDTTFVGATGGAGTSGVSGTSGTTGTSGSSGTSGIEAKFLTMEPFDGSQAVITGDGINAVTIPASLNGYDLTNVVASVEDKGITGTMSVVIRRVRGGTASDMTSTAITFADVWFAQNGVINTSNDDVLTGDRIYPDVDTIHGTASNGLSIVLEFEKP